MGTAHPSTSNPLHWKAAAFPLHIHARCLCMRCLIIDDESASRSRLKRLLANQTDIEVIGEAEDGMAGLEMIVSLVPALVFLDIEMPILNGIQMLKAIPEEKPLPLVVFITGYDEHA